MWFGDTICAPDSDKLSSTHWTAITPTCKILQGCSNVLPQAFQICQQLSIVLVQLLVRPSLTQSSDVKRGWQTSPTNGMCPLPEGKLGRVPCAITA